MTNDKTYVFVVSYTFSAVDDVAARKEMERLSSGLVADPTEVRLREIHPDRPPRPLRIQVKS
jgi:hypothetical protein